MERERAKRDRGMKDERENRLERREGNIRIK